MRATALVISFEPDLLFSSRIESVAEKVGIQVKVVTKFDELLRELERTAPQVLLVNLDSVEGNLSTLKELAQKKSCRMIGYYSHVDTRLADEARRIGIETVLSRGAFVNKLEVIVKEVLR